MWRSTERSGRRWTWAVVGSLVAAATANAGIVPLVFCDFSCPDDNDKCWCEYEIVGLQPGSTDCAGLEIEVGKRFCTVVLCSGPEQCLPRTFQIDGTNCVFDAAPVQSDCVPCFDPLAEFRFREVDTCPPDLDDDEVVGFVDLTLVLSSWGPCDPPCFADIDGNGAVGFNDLVLVLTSWGPCP